MTGYDFHPEARFDLDEIWEFIRADRTIAEILAVIHVLVPFPGRGHRRPDVAASPLHSGK